MVQKASLKHIGKRTPAKLRRLGNALFGASTVVCSVAYISDYPKLAVGALIAGGVGKFITELFTDEN